MAVDDSVKVRQALSPRVARLMRLGTYASVATAALLIAVKLVAWQITDAVSLLATLIDSVLDAAASLVNLLAVRHALSPPDAEHRFGHGKAEPLAALGQSTFIAGSAVFLVIESVRRFVSPEAVEHGWVGIAVMVFSVVATAVLVLFQRYVVRETQSLAITADSIHYRSDLLMNLAVIVALILATEFGWPIADPLFALAIAGYIIFTAWQIGASAWQMLMDRELPEEERARIGEIIMANKEVLGLHDLRTRSSGPQVFIQVHIEMEGSKPLHAAHDVADRVEQQLRDAFQGAEVIIHQDPFLGVQSPS
ncbi:MAG TPA: cation diffusion facilitator family transporter [Kiloniellaceae bacterium]|nr:cation diffusion facilitator family transporter [Kiloniellaceae bacterium]